MSGGNAPFKKGSWSIEEDTILREYVQKYGEGDWHLVHRTTGLLRCGSSCRSRWVNQLRPDISKGPLTPNEKQRIAQLHAQMGNKWAKMAEELPGRTANEIKNYWNARKTQLKSRNMTLYLGGSQGFQNMGAMQDVDQWIPNVEFQNLDLDRLASSLSPSLFDMPASSMVKQGISSQNTHSFAFPTLRPSKRPRESETKSAGERIPEPIGLCTQYDSDLSSTYDQPETGVLPGGHVLLNDNTSSSSEPMYGPMNLELPSFQYSETQQDSWCMPTFPLPSFECVDTLIQSPPVEQIQSESFCQNSVCTQYDSDLSSTYDQPETGVLTGGHVLLNDHTSSSSEPMYGPMNLELPSSQYSETQQDSWCMPTFPLPSFECVDTLIQSPPVEQIQSESLWPINSGLLDSSLYEPNSDISLQRSFIQQDPEASSVLQTDAADRWFISPSRPTKTRL